MFTGISNYTVYQDMNLLDVTFSVNTRGGPSLTYDGYRYNKHRTRRNHTYWVCSQKTSHKCVYLNSNKIKIKRVYNFRCTAQIIQQNSDNKICITNRSHSHDKKILSKKSKLTKTVTYLLGN